MSDVSHRYSPPSSDVGNASEHQSPRLGMLRVVAAFLMLYAGYIATFAVQSQSIVDALLAALLAVTAIGLWLRRQWSQYLVYAISAALVVFWLVQMQSLIARIASDPSFPLPSSVCLLCLELALVFTSSECFAASANKRLQLTAGALMLVVSLWGSVERRTIVL